MTNDPTASPAPAPSQSGGARHHGVRGDAPADFRGVLRDDLLARELYAEGAGIARTLPLAVAVPADAADVSTLVQWASRSGHSLMARGSGSGMAAGAVGAGIVVDLSRLDAIGDVSIGDVSIGDVSIGDVSIGDVSTTATRIRCGPGALRGAIDAQARRAGLQFPVDPSSGAFCTIGGMTAANASGARSLKYGPTRAWVAGVECVFDDGSVAWIRRDEPPPVAIPAVARLARLLDTMRATAQPDLVHRGVLKESSGYGLAPALRDGGSLVDLLVGSEGTLALFTQVELALGPAPGGTASLLAEFDSLEAATACALEARAAGAAACELLDRTFLDVAASKGATGIPVGAEAVLLAEVEGETALDAANEARRLADSFRARGARAVTLAAAVEDEHALWELRHATSPILASLAPRLRSMQFIEDGCVPPDALPAYVRGVRRALAKAEFPGVIFGHAGDAHVHVNPLVDVAVSGWRDRVRGALLDVCELTGALGGTLAGEHGDGRLRAGLLPHVWSDAARTAFRAVKTAADPHSVFNAGCKIAPASDELPAVLRHDPDAQPLSAEARAILDRIEQTRSWHAFRLGAIGVTPPVISDTHH